MYCLNSQQTCWIEAIRCMKLLYAIQGTGNGHLGRAIELAPHLTSEAEVDFLISGKAAELKFPYTFKYRYHGIYFIFGKRGGVNYLSSFSQLKPFRFLRDIRQCPVQDYDAVINDYEPVSAWAARRKKVPCISVSHQASFYSEKVPRYYKRNRAFEFAMMRFAPFDLCVSTHYQRYDENIYLPIIRDELVNAQAQTGNRVVVYLPAFSDELLIRHFEALKDVEWEIFSKKTSEAYEFANGMVYPVNRAGYSRALLNAKAVVIGSGFQGTSEALYLGKKLMTIPMFDQYEQLCNAAALEKLGVRSVYRIDESFSEQLRDWLNAENSCEYRFQSEPDVMARRILDLVHP